MRTSTTRVEAGLDREHGYTALSRGTDGNYLYLSDEMTRADDRHAPELEPTAMERFSADLAVSHADELALDLDDELILGL